MTHKEQAPSPNQRTMSLECENFEHWFQSALGRQLLATERRAVRRMLEGVFGAHQLELGVSHRVPVGSLGHCGHRMLAIPTWADHMPAGVVVSNPEELPFPSDTLDVVIMHHTLDFATHPHQALREAHRVLRGGGHLIIIGFNPFSSWGLWRLLHRHKRPPWSGRFIGSRRLDDWLTLLDFGIESRAFQFFRPPLQSARLLHRLHFLERLMPRGFAVPAGAFYVVLAEKRVGAMIPLRPRWKRKNVVALPVANGAHRQRVDK